MGTPKGAVDSAEETAAETARTLAEHGLVTKDGHAAAHRFIASDDPLMFLQLGQRFLGGTIEGVEWTGDSNWVVGVQWHPERMPDDVLAQRLFADFVAAARSARNLVTQKR